MVGAVGVSVITEDVLELFSHKYVLPPEAVSVMIVPLQIELLGPTEIDAVGTATTFTVTVSVAMPHELVTVTV